MDIDSKNMNSKKDIGSKKLNGGINGTSGSTKSGSQSIPDLKYEAVIGIETHIELSTATKMFCGCRLSFGDEPNSNTCPVCLGHPGSLPVINGRAIEFAIKVALALNCTINSRTIFHRKNYFYPDMPKNYQISQYDLPIGIGGWLDVDMGDYVRRVGITRVHIEEDTGKLIHTGATGRISESDSSIVDFNRAGTPLVEIVTEPDIRTPAEAKEYMINLRNLVLCLDVSDCSMEEGSLRCDANASVRPCGESALGTKTEIKNLNSFKFLLRGLEYEIARQAEVLDGGGKVIQQTRHYDNISDTTKPLRSKEEAHDYRYFPDPDLVPILIDEAQIMAIRSEIPELPAEKFRKYTEVMGLPIYDSRFLSSDRKMAQYFEKCVSLYNNPKSISNWLMGDFSAFLNKEAKAIDESGIAPESLVKLIALVDGGKISSKIAKPVFEEMFYKGGDPEAIIAEQGLQQISDEGQIDAVVAKVIADNPGVVEQLKGGKVNAIGFLVGQVMAQTKGKANPKMVNELILKKIK
jgi:aspartyl-tRNA(Asn)/glutamyl-tRNA(Gln) amidotransferase subunit B